MKSGLINQTKRKNSHYKIQKEETTKNSKQKKQEEIKN